MSIPAFSQLLANKALTEKELAELLKTAKTVPVMEKNCMRYTMVDQKTNLVEQRREMFTPWIKQSEF